VIRKQRILPESVPTPPVPVPVPAPVPAQPPQPTVSAFAEPAGAAPEPAGASTETAGVVAILSLGSNLGDRERTLRDATAQIAAVAGVTLVAASPIVETPALTLHGVDHTAPAYLNAILSVRTTLAAEALLDAMNRIENDHGRVRDVRWGDRTLDIDVISVGDVIRDDDRLTLPHPRAAERGFVLVPWLMLDPHAELPTRGPVRALPAATDNDVQRYCAEALL
jgi:2-amino-4-hydroxy-6-hydroxymethyldihydropteridine diphosphokinase